MFSSLHLFPTSEFIRICKYWPMYKVKIMCYVNIRIQCQCTNVNVPAQAVYIRPSHISTNCSIFGVWLLLFSLQYYHFSFALSPSLLLSFYGLFIYLLYFTSKKTGFPLDIKPTVSISFTFTFFWCVDVVYKLWHVSIIFSSLVSIF